MISKNREEYGILTKVVDNPRDLPSRLVYADWLEENWVRQGPDIPTLIRSLMTAGRPNCNHTYRPATSPPWPVPRCPGCRYDKMWKALLARHIRLAIILGKR